jgi:hypothetical protein
MNRSPRVLEQRGDGGGEAVGHELRGVGGGGGEGGLTGRGGGAGWDDEVAYGAGDHRREVRRVEEPDVRGALA